MRTKIKKKYRPYESKVKFHHCEECKRSYHFSKIVNHLYYDDGTLKSKLRCYPCDAGKPAEPDTIAVENS